MAADGVIRINTSIENAGFIKGTKQLEAAARRAAANVTDIGEKAQVSLAKAVNGFAKNNAAYAQQEQKVRALKQQLAELSRSRVKTDDYKQLEAEMSRLDKEIAKVDERKRRFLETGGKENSSAFRKLEYDADQLTAAYERARQAKEALEQSGKAYQPADTSGLESKVAAEYNRLISMGRSLETEYAGVQERISSLTPVEDPTEELEPATERTHRFRNALKSLGSAIGSLISKGFTKLKDAFGGVQKSSQKGFMTILKYGLGIRSLYFLFRKLRAAIKEGFNNLAQFDGSVNASLSSITSSLTTCKNALATAFAPILSYITPALITLINLVTRAANALGAFFAALTGKSTYSKAIAVQQDYAASLNGTADAAGAAAEAAKNLSGLDEITTWDSGSSGGGGGSGSVSPSEMFSTESIPENLMALAQNGDWAAIATALTDKLNTAIANIDWAGIGQKAGTFFDNALLFLATAVTTFNWVGLGSDIATFLNNVIETVDWTNLGVLLVSKWTSLFGLLDGLFADFHWDSLGIGIADTLLGAFYAIDWGQAARVVSNGLKGLITTISSAIKNIDWWQLGEDVFTAISDTLSNIDWIGIVTAACDCLGAAIGGASALIAGLATAAWEAIKAGFESIKTTYFEPYMNELGELTIEGFFQGLLDMLSDIGTWIVDNIFTPFINGFKAAFGIQSPSTVMEEQGGFVGQGLLNGIANVFENVKAWVQEHILDKLQAAIDAAGELVATVKANVVKGARWVKDAWNALQVKAGTVTRKIKAAVQKGATWVKDAWEALKTTAGIVTKKVKAAVSKASTWVKDAWTALTTTATTVIKKVKAAVSKASTWVKDAWSAVNMTAQTVTRTVKAAIQKASTWVADAWSAANMAAQTVTRTVKASLQKAATWISDAWSAANMAAQTVTRTVKASLQKAATWVADAWTAAKMTAQTVTRTIYSAVQKASTWISDAWTAAKATAGSVTRTLYQSVQKASTWVADAWAAFQGKASSTVNTYVSLLRNNWTTVSDWVKQKLGSGVSVTVSLIKGWYGSIKRWLGLSEGGTISQSGAFKLFSGGGVIRNGFTQLWNSIPKYAGGTAGAHGTMFVAGEAGPEVVGHIHSRTEVLNKSQLAETMKAAVESGMAGIASTLGNAIMSRLADCANAIINALLYVQSNPLTTFTTAFDTAVASLDSMALAIDRMTDLLPGVVTTAPLMATGAVIPPQATQASSQYSELREIVSELAAASQNPPSGTSGGNTYQFVAQLNRRTLFTQVIEEALLQRDISGVNPFELNR